MRQADAIVSNHKQLGFLVRFQCDFQRGIIPILLVAQLNMPKLIQRIGSVRNQLSQGNLAVLIQRMRENMKKLLDLGLKREFLRLRHGELQKQSTSKQKGSPSTAWKDEKQLARHVPCVKNAGNL